MTIGEMLKERRLSLGLTLEQVGEHLGVNKATVQRYETGDLDIRRTTAIKLAEIYSTTPAAIMGWEEMSPLLDDNQIIKIYNSLNDDGKDALLEYASYLSTVKRFKK